MTNQSTPSPRSSFPVEPEDLEHPITHFLNLPIDTPMASGSVFGELFDNIYKLNNPAKRSRLGEEVEESHHITRDGYLVNKNKMARRYEMTQSTIFISMEVIYREIAKLQKQMTEIAKAIADLTTSMPQLIKGQVEDITKKLDTLDPAQFPPLSASIEKTVKSAVKDSIRSDSNDRLRKFQVFLRNLSTEKSDSDSIKELSDKIAGPTPTKFFRLKGKESSVARPLILTFSSAEEAVSFIKLLAKAKRDDDFPFKSVMARPNYSPEEEKKFHAAWADACARNDEAGQKQFVVRGLKVVKLDSPGVWTKRERPARV